MAALVRGSNGEWSGATMPDALGTKHELPGTWDPVQRHFMSQVVAGLESQKEEDQATVEAGLSLE